MTIRTGGCLCGDIQIEASGTPVTMGECHCRQCQKNCGGNAAAFVVYPKAAVKLSKGELRFYKTVADSGNKIARGFCPQCGTPIMSTLDRTDDVVIVKLGALDDPSFFTPRVEFWTSAAHRWTDFPEDAIQFSENPPPLKT